MKISDIFDTIFKQHKLNKHKVDIFSAWPNIVLRAFGASAETFVLKETIINTINNSKLYDIKNDKIIVEVKHSGWMQILLTKQNKILEIIQSEYDLKNVKSIKFILVKS
jgi:hypothetical protein